MKAPLLPYLQNTLLTVPRAAVDLHLSCSLPAAYKFLVNRDSIFSLLLVSPANPGAHYTLWPAQLNKHSRAGKLKEQPGAMGRLTSVIPVVGELATVSVRMSDGAEMSPKY